ncbi:MAG: 5'-nucleotidase C-terminal domain-containing protein [Lachnospirales bacterium]
MKKFIKTSVAALALSFALVAPVNVFAQGQDFVIMHNNDTHSRTFGEEITKGFKDFYEAKGEEVLLLHAGDATQGQPISSMTSGKANIEIMNQVPYDYMAPGNHEFDYGFENIMGLQELANFPMLASNIVYADTGELVFEGGRIVELENGTKVGLFGLTTPETQTKSIPTATEGLTFLDTYEVAKAETEKLTAEGADLVVLVTHMGIDKESEITSEKIAQKVDGIDLIVDGHSHTHLENGMQVNDTLIVQTGDLFKYIGVVNVDFDEAGEVTLTAKTISTDFETTPLGEEYADYSPNADVAEFVKGVTAEADAKTQEVVLNIPITLDGEREDVRTKETNLSNMIANSQKAATGSDLVLVNGGGIRATIESGDVTLGDLITTLPYGNTIITKEIKGSDFKAAVEHGIQSYPEPAGGFPHIAGAKITFDPAKEAGKRIVSITDEDGSEFDLDATYTIAINEFLGLGGDGYEMFKDYPVLAYYNTGLDILMDYLKTGGEILEAPAGYLVPVTDEATEDTTEDTTEMAEIVTETAEVRVEDTESKVIETEVIVPVETTEMEKLEPAKEITATEGTYIVIKGDNLYNIGLAHNTTWRVLADLNDINSPYLIFPDQVLKIK